MNRVSVLWSSQPNELNELTYIFAADSISLRDYCKRIVDKGTGFFNYFQKPTAKFAYGHNIGIR